MKKKDIKELVTKEVSELKKQLSDLINKLKKIQIDQKVGKLKNTNLYGEVLKDIARIKTVIRQKEQTKL
ncbi:50S ribosomal protein L29 [Candidatus Gottesmanbacteria bacterium RIFCSPLOWO2_02_FULL_38_8]|uniref:Large ribosomal subunit protein uL29 n=1 Tax=Candidatus Gottesmanbacteria bacterium RIFCSPLOWO2_02_FULL_38_8 TaxID=1798397 RepID=A0A1F6B2Z8_9BACT|nr:MAG: 50S ribosomal protein L29 [Candidatus Gottesmanbacteria bacterium RIFCSPLOWO2_02_FULL_38_8]